MWRLAVARSPRWAWAGATLGALGVIGQTVHLTGYFGLQQVLAAQPDPRAAAHVSLAMDTLPFTLALFLPYLLGFVATVPQAVALRRARVIPLSAVLAVCAGTAPFAVVGSQPWSTVLYTGALLIGLTPAATAMLRNEPKAAAAPVPLEAVA